MTLNSTRAVQSLAICSAVGLVVASAGFGAVYAYRVGIQHSILLAVLSVLMALGLEGCKPLAIAYALRSKSILNGLLLASLGLVAIAYSLTSELSLMASTRGDLVATRDASSHAAREAVGRIERINDELRSLGVQRPSDAVQAELNPLVADKRLANCQGWLANVRLRDTCIEKVSPLQAELAKAVRREKLEDQLGQASNEGSPAVSTSDPGSEAMRTYLTALGIALPLDAISQWLVLVPVLALELGSAVALVLVHSIVVQNSAVQAQHARPRRKLPPNRLQTKSEMAHRIVLALQAHGGSLTGNERDMAAKMGGSRPTVRRAILFLEGQGAVKRLQNRTGTRLELITT